ncbi:TPA: glycosyltransferase, partial [Klebsiella pneumoniae]|nr:glycosyltransferase [Klebsiella pneumoniae]
IKQKATKNIEILGYQPDATMTDYMKKAKAFVFAAEEDFGITPVEAQACGTPVIAFGKGGVLETIKGLDQESPTGVFFYEQKVDSLINAVHLFISNQNK